MSMQAPPPPAAQPYGHDAYGAQPPVPGYGGYPPPMQPMPPMAPPPKRRSVGKIIGIVAGAFVAVMAALFVLVMVFGNPVITADQVEAQIAQQYGVAPSQVSCPSSLEGEVGATITCTGTENGQTVPLLVQVTAVDGDNVNFSITPQQ